MFNFYFSSDLHFDYFKPFSKYFPDGTSSRLHNLLMVLERGLAHANTDTVVYAGDILNRARNIDPVLSNYVRQYFQALINDGKRVIVLPGNHDLRMSFKTTHSMLKPLLPDKVEYFGDPTTLAVTQDILFHILPFYPSVDVMKQQLNEFKLEHDKINILVSHFTVSGAKITDDFSMGKKYGYINPSDLKMFDYCFLGDIHKSQELDSFIFYPGSPLQHNFGEEEDTKYTWKIGISNAGIKKEKILSNAPVFKTLYIEKEEDIQQITAIDKEKTFLRVFSNIPLGDKVDITKFTYVEIPKGIELDMNLDYKDIIVNFIKERKPHLLDLLVGKL